MENDLFFVREKLLAEQLKVTHIPGTYHYQWADVLTNYQVCLHSQVPSHESQAQMADSFTSHPP